MGGDNGRKRGTRLPEDWRPTTTDCEFAANRGLDVLETADEFRDHWRSESRAIGVKLDWAATWRNWCRRNARRDALWNTHRAAKSDTPGPARAMEWNPADFGLPAGTVYEGTSAMKLVFRTPDGERMERDRP